jgi:hypothetical protein
MHARAGPRKNGPAWLPDAPCGCKSARRAVIDAVRIAVLENVRRAGRALGSLRTSRRVARRVGLRVLARRGVYAALLSIRRDRTRALPDRRRTRRGPLRHARGKRPPARQPQTTARLTRPMPALGQRRTMPHLHVPAARMPNVLLPRRGRPDRKPRARREKRRQRHRKTHCGPFRAGRAERPPPPSSRSRAAPRAAMTTVLRHGADPSRVRTRAGFFARRRLMFPCALERL